VAGGEAGGHVSNHVEAAFVKERVGTKLNELHQKLQLENA